MLIACHRNSDHVRHHYKDDDTTTSTNLCNCTEREPSPVSTGRKFDVPAEIALAGAKYVWRWRVPKGF